MKRKPSAGWASIVQGKQAISTIKGKKKKEAGKKVLCE